MVSGAERIDHAKAGVYASRIVRNHPLVDGNKRTAWQVMR